MSTPETPQGLSPDELQAEQATDLPEREAMLVLDPGGILHPIAPLPPIIDLPELPETEVPGTVHIEPET